eukprot:2004309-Prymnesium_polylepis.1
MDGTRAELRTRERRENGAGRVHLLWRKNRMVTAGALAVNDNVHTSFVHLPRAVSNTPPKRSRVCA